MTFVFVNLIIALKYMIEPGMIVDCTLEAEHYWGFLLRAICKIIAVVKIFFSLLLKCSV